MIKMVDLLVRKDGMTHEEFVEYWMDEHVPLAEEMPYVRKYVTSVPRDPEKAGYDGIAELYFDDTDDISAAFESDAGQKTQEDAAKFIDLDEGPTNAERVVRFLARNADQAYRAAEIAAATDVNENSVHPVLKRLHDRGLVRHRAPYWAIGDEDRVREAFAFRSVASHLDERLGTENREEWLAAAEEGPDGGDGSDDFDDE